jgi:hypothetical protein
VKMNRMNTTKCDDESMSIIDAIFQPIYGKYCWNVANGIGSFLTFEFGEPHFKIVKEPSVSKIPKNRRHAARRKVAIRGDWHLWIKYCDWSFYNNNTIIGNSESPKKELKQIALDLNGQSLCSVKVNRSWNSIFEFDLGGCLETQPYSQKKEESEPEELWSLYQPSGMVFTLRSDGKYNHSMGNHPRTKEWILIETNPE